MRQRRLWTDGPDVGVIGLGCMGMSWGYQESARNDDASIRLIRRAIDVGVSFLDTSDAYGDGHNERLLGRALHGRRDQVTLATKGGLIVDDVIARDMHRDGSPEHLRAAVDASLRRLRTDVIDLYYLHRVDDTVPIEESWAALAEAVTAGKVRALGLSEVSVAQAGAAHRIHPVRAIQSELSLWTPEPLTVDGSGTSVLEWCAANGAAFVPFAPLGRGFLSGRIARHDQFEAGDFRATSPRFEPAALAANLSIVDSIRTVAGRRAATPAQVALAWTLTRGDHVVPIPGTKQEPYLLENIGAADLQLTAADLAELDRVPAAVGSRY
jgi:aryl-alcohol dehydrogenase-like predicted oxidoreductase